jgi:hypothetical protein
MMVDLVVLIQMHLVVVINILMILINVNNLKVLMVLNNVIKIHQINVKKRNVLIILQQQLIKIVIHSYLVVVRKVLDVYHQQNLVNLIKEH